MTTGKTIALTRRAFVGKVMSLFLNMLSRLVTTFLPRSKRLNLMAAVTICSDFEAQKNKVWHCFHCFPIYSPWSDATGSVFVNNILLEHSHAPFVPMAMVAFNLRSAASSCDRDHRVDIYYPGLHRKILAKTFPREHLEKCVGVWGCHRDLSWGCSWHLSGMVTTLHREEPPCQPYNSGPAEKLARQVRSESREGGYS